MQGVFDDLNLVELYMEKFIKYAAVREDYIIIETYSPNLERTSINRY
jgi:hypothetical protein